MTIKPRLLKEVTKSKNSAQPLEEKNLGTRTTFKGKTSCDAHGENKVAECNQAAANDKDLESNRREDESLAGILKLCTSVSNGEAFKVN